MADETTWDDVKAVLDDPAVPPENKTSLISSWMLGHADDSNDDVAEYAKAYNGSPYFSAQSVDDAYNSAKQKGDQNSYNDDQDKKAVDEGKTQLGDKQEPASGGAGTKNSDEIFDAAAPALKVFQTFGSLLAQLPDDCRGQTRALDFANDIQKRYDEQRGIDFQGFMDDADHTKTGSRAIDQTLSDTSTALSTLYQSWSGGGANAASDQYSQQIQPKATKLSQTLESVSEATSATVSTVFQLCKGKADAIIDLYSDQVGKADYAMAQKVVAVANGQHAGRNDLAQIAGWMDLNFGTDLVKTLNDDGCCDDDEIQKYGEDLAKQWIQKQFNPDMWDTVYLGFDKACKDALDLVNQAYDALDQVMDKVRNDFGTGATASTPPDGAGTNGPSGDDFGSGAGSGGALGGGGSGGGSGSGDDLGGASGDLGGGGSGADLPSGADGSDSPAGGGSLPDLPAGSGGGGSSGSSPGSTSSPGDIPPLDDGSSGQGGSGAGLGGLGGDSGSLTSPSGGGPGDLGGGGASSSGGSSPGDIPPLDDDSSAIGGDLGSGLDRSGTPKDFKLDWPGDSTGDPGAAAGGQPAGGAYQPGPDGKIHIQDGDLKITAKRPDGADGPTVVTVDDGQGPATTYSLGEDHAAGSSSDAPAADGPGSDGASGDLADPPPGNDAVTDPNADLSGGGDLGGGGGDLDGGSLQGSLGDTTSLAENAGTGAGGQPAVTPPAAPLAPVAPAAAAAAQPTSGMSGMPSMGGMGAGGQGGGDHERGTRAYRIDGGIFDRGEKPGPSIIGSLEDDEKPAKRRR